MPSQNVQDKSSEKQALLGKQDKAYRTFASGYFSISEDVFEDPRMEWTIRLSLFLGVFCFGGVAPTWKEIGPMGFTGKFCEYVLFAMFWSWLIYPFIQFPCDMILKAYSLSFAYCRPCSHGELKQTEAKMPLKKHSLADEKAAAAKLALSAGESEAPKHGSVDICVAATFTADPLKRPLQMWGDRLKMPFNCELTDYGSVFAQLLQPGREFSRSGANRVNVILFRLEDWLPSGSTTVDTTIEATADSFVRAVKTHAETSKHQLIICECKPSPRLVASAQLASVSWKLCRELSSVQGVSYITTGTVDTLYPVDTYASPEGDSKDTGHLPYTDAYMVAIATSIMRKIIARLGEQAKVYVVDCDNTLWEGIVSEDGARSLNMSGVHSALQEKLVALKNSGRLLCIASKNDDVDVRNVFVERASHMKLKPEDITAWALNWEDKSTNIQKLAKSLNLSLDHFVFIDDSPAEIERVRLNLPQVTCVHFPKMAGDDAAWATLDHTWCLDLPEGVVTKEDLERTALYEQEMKRQDLRQASPSITMQEFVASLGVAEDLHAMTQDEQARVVQLTQRTNQFNSTGIRRSESDVSGWIAANRGVVSCNVQDRFGDYGLVAAAFWECKQGVTPMLLVDSWLMSCRVFDRGVECAMLRHLAGVAESMQCNEIGIQFIRTAKNKKVEQLCELLTSVTGGRVLQDDLNGENSEEHGRQFVVPAKALWGLTMDDLIEVAPEVDATPGTSDARQVPSTMHTLSLQATASTVASMRTVPTILQVFRAVLLNGLWVELPLVETAAASVDGISGARAILWKDDKDQGRLVVYVRGAAGKSAAVLDASRQQLQPHMVPSTVVCLEALPRASEWPTESDGVWVCPRPPPPPETSEDDLMGMSMLMQRIQEVGVLEVMQDQEAANAGWGSLELMRLAGMASQKQQLSENQQENVALAGALGHVWLFTMILVSMEWLVALGEPMWFNAVGGVAELTPTFSAQNFSLVERLQSIGCLCGDPFFLMLSGLQDFESLTQVDGAGKLIRRSLLYGGLWLACVVFSRILLRGPYLDLAWTTSSFTQNESNATGVLFEGNFIGGRAFMALMCGCAAWVCPGGGRIIRLPFLEYPVVALVCSITVPAFVWLLAPSESTPVNPSWISSMLFAMDVRRYLGMYGSFIRELSWFYFFCPLFTGGLLFPRWRAKLTKGLDPVASGLFCAVGLILLGGMLKYVGTDTLNQVRGAKSHGPWRRFVTDNFVAPPSEDRSFWSTFVEDHDVFQAPILGFLLVAAVCAAPTTQTIFSRTGTQILSVYLTLPLVLIPVCHFFIPLILQSNMPNLMQDVGIVSCGLLTIFVAARSLPESMLRWVERGTWQ